MLASHASAPAKLNLVVPKDTLSRVASVSDATGLENQIRERAYQLYEKRGREHGVVVNMVRTSRTGSRPSTRC